jgi:hypothetical protein
MQTHMTKHWKKEKGAKMTVKPNKSQQKAHACEKMLDLPQQPPADTN